MVQLLTVEDFIGFNHMENHILMYGMMLLQLPII